MNTQPPIKPLLFPGKVAILVTFWGPFRVPESEDTSYESRKYDISMSRLCPSLKAARGNRRHSPGGGRRGLQQFARHFNGGEGLLKIHINIVLQA